MHIVHIHSHTDTLINLLHDYEKMTPFIPYSERHTHTPKKYEQMNMDKYSTKTQ